MPLPKTIAVVILITLIHFMFWFSGLINGWSLPNENSLMENTQFFLNMISATFFFFTFLAVQGFIPKFYYFGFFFLCVTYFVREIEVVDFVSNPVLIWLWRGPGYMLWMSIIWSLLTILLVLNRRGIWKMFLSWVKTTPGKLFVIGGTFLLIGLIFDGQMVPMPRLYEKFAEEFSETNGYLLILIAAVINFYQRDSIR